MKQIRNIGRLYCAAPEMRYVVLPLAALWLGLCALAVAVLPPEVITIISHESGPVEGMTVVFYAFAALLGLLGYSMRRTKGQGYFTVLMAFAAARELDLHKRFTHDSILKLKYYAHSPAPLVEKILAALLVLLVVYCCIRALMMLPQVVELVAQNRSTVLVLPGLAFLIVGKLIDSGGRLVPSALGFFHEHGIVLVLMEETAELTASLVFLCVAAGTLWAQRKARKR